jgi:hypothetical protein
MSTGVGCRLHAARRPLSWYSSSMRFGPTCCSLLALALVIACGRAAKAPPRELEEEATRDPVPMGFRDPREALVDASTVDASAPTDAAAEAEIAVTGPWSGAASCAKLERPRAFGCCNPSPDVSLCIVEHGANHVPGLYVARVLTVKDAPSQRVLASITVELRKHGSMKMPDGTVGSLELAVRPWGFELSSRYDCDPKTTPATKRMCEARGKHVWKDGSLSFAPAQDK